MLFGRCFLAPGRVVLPIKSMVVYTINPVKMSAITKRIILLIRFLRASIHQQSDGKNRVLKGLHQAFNQLDLISFRNSP